MAHSKALADREAGRTSPVPIPVNAEAGPSDLTRRHSPLDSLSPEQLDSLVASKRHRQPHKTLLRTSHHVKQGIMDGKDGRRTYGADDDDDGEMISERWLREEERRCEEEAQAARETRKSLKIKKGDRQWDFAYYDSDEDQAAQPGEDNEDQLPKAEEGYVWDVLFENQRGIYIFGKGYFSSNSLLPLDPSAFTVPIVPPRTSDITMSRSTSRSSRSGTRKLSRKAKPARNPSSASSGTKASQDSPPPARRKTINTAYDLDTYQLPSPEWEWVTPWLINMRDGVDEAGWRYNYWFRRQKWKSHAGPAGWGGWVRRREWVRLRRAAPHGREDPADGSPSKPRPAEHHTKLSNLFTTDQDPELDLDRLIRGTSARPLDRERLDAWKDWLSAADSDQTDRLSRVLDDDRLRDGLRSCFVYGSSYDRLLVLLREQGMLPAEEERTEVDTSHIVPRKCYLQDTPPVEAADKPYDL